MATSLPCTLSDSTGYYDLRGLYKKQTDYIIKTPSNNNHLINFCGPRTWAVQNGNTQGVYVEGSHGGISLGQFNTTISNFNGVLSLTYNGGSTCPISASTRSSIIQLTCGTNSNTLPLFVGSINDCAYFYTFSTPYACKIGILAGIGTSIGTSIWVFFSFLIIAAIVSLLSAVTYNRLVLKKRGMDQFPSIEVIREGLSFAKDMIVIVVITLLDFFSNLSSKFGISRRTSQAVDYTKGAWSRSARDGFGFDRLPTDGLMRNQEGNSSGEVEDVEEGLGNSHQRFRDDEH